jgi:hypothetical protein
MAPTLIHAGSGPPEADGSVDRSDSKGFTVGGSIILQALGWHGKPKKASLVGKNPGLPLMEARSQKHFNFCI